MTAPTDRSEPLSGPTAQQLADAAHLRAWGHDWESVGAAVRCEWLALRRAAGADPGFAAALAREDAAATREGEAKALRRLRAWYCRGTILMSRNAVPTHWPRGAVAGSTIGVGI